MGASRGLRANDVSLLAHHWSTGDALSGLCGHVFTLPQSCHAAVGRTIAVCQGSPDWRSSALGLVAQRWLLIQLGLVKLSPLRKGRTWANALKIALGVGSC
eukprot:6886433-Pyramimonas_sp.AAC.1